MKKPKLNGRHAIAEAVQSSLDEYFVKLDGEVPDNVHEMVMASVEHTILVDILQRAEGNQTLAAEMLGMTRATLRNKLTKHRIPA